MKARKCYIVCQHMMTDVIGTMQKGHPRYSYWVVLSRIKMFYLFKQQ